MCDFEMLTLYKGVKDLVYKEKSQSHFAELNGLCLVSLDRFFYAPVFFYECQCLFIRYI